MPLFLKADDVKWDESCPTASELIVAGKKISIVLATVRPGHVYPEPETHPEEQVNIILKGTMEWVLGENQDDVYITGPNSILVIEANMPHSSRLIGDEEAFVITAFCPRRHLERAIKTLD